MPAWIDAIGPVALMAEGRLEAPGASRADRAMQPYACGDEAAFAELHDELPPRLHRFALRWTRGITRGMVKIRAHRATAALREALNRRLGDAPEPTARPAAAHHAQATCAREEC
jgi:hypothetical protein